MPHNIVSEAIEDYARAHTLDEAAILQELAAETRATMKLAQMLTGHLEGTLLRMLVKLVNAKSVLEIGTFTGYSALTMAHGLPDDGLLITCDIDPEATAIARKYWVKSEHGKKIQLMLSPALDTLSRLDETFDLVFIDADKENYINYWEACVPMIRSGGLLVVDNTLWDGKVLNPQDKLDHAIVAFNKHVHGDTRVEAVMLTVRDGVTVARKK